MGFAHNYKRTVPIDSIFEFLLHHWDTPLILSFLKACPFRGCVEADLDDISSLEFEASACKQCSTIRIWTAIITQQAQLSHIFSGLFFGSKTNFVGLSLADHSEPYPPTVLNNAETTLKACYGWYVDERNQLVPYELATSWRCQPHSLLDHEALMLKGGAPLQP